MQGAESHQHRERMTGPVTVETARLRLRRFDQADAAFVLRLVNEPSWLRFIGDRGVRSLEDAQAYLRDGPQRMYEQFGFGLWLVERKSDGASLGMCGLIKRDTLDDIDIGFALLPEFWRHGYAYEAAAATLAHARDALGLSRVVAITSEDNDASGSLLEKLGFEFEQMIPVVASGESLRLYGTSLALE
jgi:RimJ/RimL family protein N-acetyltransferase